jgi:hypothetical protein
MMKVNTFIVGAPKAGTTSLHHYLDQHSEVSMSSVKEPNFFSIKEVTPLFYNSLCIASSEAYHKLFVQEKQIMGEASVSYLFYDEVPKRIHDYNAKAKIIIMLRQPIERAFSHYLMDSRLGFCSKTLEEIIAHPQKHPQFHQQYVELGSYYSQLERYLSIFKKEQLKVIFYEDFKNDTLKEMSSLFDFLGIDDQPLDLSVQNSFLSPSNSFIAFLYTFNWIRKGVKLLVPFSLIAFLKKTFLSGSKKPVISNEVKEKLKHYYQDDVRQLEKLLNIDLSRWDIK